MYNNKDSFISSHCHGTVLYMVLTYGSQILLAPAFRLTTLLDDFAQIQGHLAVLQFFSLSIQLGRVLGGDVLLVLASSPCNNSEFTFLESFLLNLQYNILINGLFPKPTKVASGVPTTPTVSYKVNINKPGSSAELYPLQTQMLTASL